MSNKAVFLDRDKTVILPKRENYIYKVGDFIIPQNYIDALLRLYNEGFMLFVVTNQGRVAKGCLTEQDVNDVHNYLDKLFQKRGLLFQEFAYCPHNPEGDLYPYNIVCSCRKPNTGMLDKLVDKYEVDVKSSWMIGDSRKDILAGRKKGLKTILVRTGYFNNVDEAQFVEDDLVGAVNRILLNK